MKRALIVVDVQNDFLPGGALGVKDGDQIIPGINEAMTRFDCVVVSQDWHPASHCSFIAQGGPWPPHCVKNTSGAELAEGLHLDQVDEFILKGTYPSTEAYSAFDARNINLSRYLNGEKATDVYVCGLALDYCVKATAIDSVKAGFHTYVVLNLTKSVFPQNNLQTHQELDRAGVHVIGAYR